MDSSPVTPPIRRWLNIWMIYLGLTLVLGAIPYLMYWHAIATHQLPSQATWAARGHDYGPWVGTWQVDVISTCFLVLLWLIPVSFSTGIVQCFTRRHWWPILAGIALAAMQLGLFYAQFAVLFWTVDEW